MMATHQCVQLSCHWINEKLFKSLKNTKRQQDQNKHMQTKSGRAANASCSHLAKFQNFSKNCFALLRSKFLKHVFIAPGWIVGHWAKEKVFETSLLGLPKAGWFRFSFPIKWGQAHLQFGFATRASNLPGCRAASLKDTDDDIAMFSAAFSLRLELS